MPSTSTKPKSAFKPNKSKAPPSTIIQPPPLASHHDDGSDDEEDDEDEDEDDLELDDSEEDEFEEDRLRTGRGVAVWEDDEGEEFDEESSEGEEEEEEEDEVAAQSSRLAKGKGRETELSKLQSGLRDIPLSTLLKVNRSLPKHQRHNHPESADEDDLSGSEREGEETEKERQKRERVAEAREKLAQMMAGKKGGASAGGAGEGGGEEERAYRERERKALAKRADKHAPQVLSSKKQVSRKRQVIEIDKVERRDPRFSNLSGSLDPHLHSKAYSFLPTMLSAELTDLQASLKVAKKAVLSAPRHERRDKEAEVERIEMELGKVRTRREREARERREREAVGKWKKEERAKRGEGKKEWHLKDADKKRLLAEAKHAALLEQGGQFAVKKSLDKRLKKDAGKEKKARPRGLDGASGAEGSRKRVKM